MVFMLVLYIDKNAGIYGPNTMYFRILSACESIIAGYFGAFLRVSCHESHRTYAEDEIFPGREYSRGTNRIATLSQIIHSMLGNIIC